MSLLAALRMASLPVRDGKMFLKIGPAQCVAFQNIQTKISVGSDSAGAARDDNGGGDGEDDDRVPVDWGMLSAATIAHRVNVYFMVQGKVAKPRRDRLAEIMIHNEAMSVRRYHILRHLYFHHRKPVR